MVYDHANTDVDTQRTGQQTRREHDKGVDESDPIQGEYSKPKSYSQVRLRFERLFECSGSVRDDYR
jgi:hypothetical protein